MFTSNSIFIFGINIKELNVGWGLGIKYTIAGKHCESGDVLFKEIELANCETGDLICVFGTGAYNNSMSSNYNRIPRPGALLVCNGEAEIIQKRESPIDLLKYDVLPDRFIK